MPRADRIVDTARRSAVRHLVWILLALVVAVLVGGCPGGGGSYQSWSVTLRGDTLEIAYGRGSDYPQYAVLHLDSGCLRMVYGPDCGWGTSVVVMPSFWERGNYYQGAPIQAAWSIDGDVLVVSFSGTIQDLDVTGTISLSPPAHDSIRADVAVDMTGTVNLDDRPGEAFKPVMLSSMHVSSENCDCQSAYAWRTSFGIPASGEIVDPPVSGSAFGLEGGTSAWKTNAPTVDVQLQGTMPISGYPIRGWVTASDDPNDDNVGLWASWGPADHWEYYLVVRRAEP
jgi:hypothetical protein